MWLRTILNVTAYLGKRPTEDVRLGHLIIPIMTNNDQAGGLRIAPSNDRPIKCLFVDVVVSMLVESRSVDRFRRRKGERRSPSSQHTSFTKGTKGQAKTRYQRFILFSLAQFSAMPSSMISKPKSSVGKLASNLRNLPKKLHNHLTGSEHDGGHQIEIVAGGKRKPFDSVPTMISVTSESDLDHMVDHDDVCSSSGSGSSVHCFDVNEMFRSLEDADTSERSGIGGGLDDPLIPQEDWNKQGKAKTLKEIDHSLKKLGQVMEDVKKEHYHKNLIMKVKFRTDAAGKQLFCLSLVLQALALFHWPSKFVFFHLLASVHNMKDILRLESHRERIIRATHKLELLREEVQDKPILRKNKAARTDGTSSSCASSTASASAASGSVTTGEKVNFLARMKLILTTPGPAVTLRTFPELYDEVKARIEATSMLQQQQKQEGTSRPTTESPESASLVAL